MPKGPHVSRSTKFSVLNWESGIRCIECIENDRIEIVLIEGGRVSIPLVSDRQCMGLAALLEAIAEHMKSIASSLPPF